LEVETWGPDGTKLGFTVVKKIPQQFLWWKWEAEEKKFNSLIGFQNSQIKFLEVVSDEKKIQKS